MKKKLHFLLAIICMGSISITAYSQTSGAGNAYDFASQHMSTPNNPTLNPTTITLEAWIKADSWGTNSWENVIVSKDGWMNGNEGYVLRAGANGTLSFNFSGAGTWREVTSTPQMQLGKWYHVAGTYDGTTLRAYINGVEVGTTAYTGTITNGTYDLYIGRAAYTSGGTRYFDGNIDEVRIWNTAVSQTALQDYMCQKINPAHPNFASLVSHYQFNNPSPLDDSSPNGNTLTNAGATQQISGAAIGDESTHQYGGPYNLNIGYGMVDDITVQSSNSMSTIHLYRVDMSPNTINASATIDSMDYSHYYGVYVGSIASYNYSLAYDYYGNPMGLTNAAYLNLAGRIDGSGPSWAPQGATVNQATTTVNKTFNNRTEVMLAIACKNINLNVSGTQNLCTGETLNAFDQAVNSNYQWYNANGAIANETTNAYTITATGDYYLVANDGLCVDTSSMINVVINPNPIVDFGTLSTTHCENELSTPILNPTPMNGIFSGAGISGTDFDPGLAGAGSHTLYYNVTDVNGCSGIDSITVNVYPQPNAPVITQTGDVLCISGGAVGAIYQWSINGSTVSAGTDTCYTALENGTYSVTSTNSFGCESDASTATVAGVGIEENVLTQFIQISPNPTNGVVVVSSDLTDSNLRITLRDINGKILDTKSGSSLIEFDLGPFEAGVYLIDCEHGDQRIVKRVVRD